MAYGREGILLVAAVVEVLVGHGDDEVEQRPVSERVEDHVGRGARPAPAYSWRRDEALEAGRG
jgi:hypothetical protein